MEPAVLVVSCDRYRDLWRPFFTIFRKRWPDCPYPVFLGTNRLEYTDHGVTTIAIGEDSSWAGGVRSMLERIESDWVLFMLEDFLLTAAVDTERVQRYARMAREENVGCLRLVSEPPLAFLPSHPVPGHPEVGELAKWELNRVTAQVAIWRRETLMQLLIPGATAWEFETVGTALSNRLPDRFWGVWEEPIHYIQAVEKGKWTPAGLRVCHDLGVAIDRDARGTFSQDELIEHYERATGGAESELARIAALASFRAGNRAGGLRWMARSLRRNPRSLRLWASAVSGMAGARALSWIESNHLDWKIKRIRRRVE